MSAPRTVAAAVAAFLAGRLIRPANAAVSAWQADLVFTDPGIIRIDGMITEIATAPARSDPARADRWSPAAIPDGYLSTPHQDQGPDGAIRAVRPPVYVWTGPVTGPVPTDGVTRIQGGAGGRLYILGAARARVGTRTFYYDLYGDLALTTFGPVRLQHVNRAGTDVGRPPL